MSKYLRENSAVFVQLSPVTGIHFYTVTGDWDRHSIIDITFHICKLYFFKIQNSFFGFEEYLGQTHLDIERLNGPKIRLNDD